MNYIFAVDNVNAPEKRPARRRTGGETMSSFYAFPDPVTRQTRFYYGYLMDCPMNLARGCPYAMLIDDALFCNHPHGRKDCVER